MLPGRTLGAREAGATLARRAATCDVTESVVAVVVDGAGLGDGLGLIVAGEATERGVGEGVDVVVDGPSAGGGAGGTGEGPPMFGGRDGDLRPQVVLGHVVGAADLDLVVDDD